MAIYRLLQKSAFEPEDVKILIAAYEMGLSQLGLRDRNDPATELLAKLIIEVGQTGEKTPEKICAVALSQLGIDRAAG